MEIWDEIKKSVADAAAYTASKTTELTGIAKLKMNIHSGETKLYKCFEDIGRLFYISEREGEDNAAAISALIMQADKLSADIAAARAELAKMKNTYVCDGCGAEISNECSFCPVCGKKLDQEGCGCGCEPKCDNAAESDDTASNCNCSDGCCSWTESTDNKSSDEE